MCSLCVVYFPLSCLAAELHARLTGDRLPGGTFSEHAHPCSQGDLLHSGVGHSTRLSSLNTYLFLKESEEKSLLKFKICFTSKLAVSWCWDATLLRKSCKVPSGMSCVCRSSKMPSPEMLGERGSQPRAGRAFPHGRNCYDIPVHHGENAFWNRDLVFLAEKAFSLPSSS